ncbi:MAG: DUF835 domain-containing protein [Candidatus Poseidoniales archaeon]|nr:MAG: DUF835 domain-containing protein [Candidatus Poseidoniales archaeon]
MFDFKPGDVLETRKGGANTLRHLAQELATLEQDGSILIERRIPEIGVRTGHLLIFDGTLASAFHQADTARFGIEALLEIESDASALDATLSLHEMSKQSFLASSVAYPEANLVDSKEEQVRDEAWWATVRAPVRRLDRDEKLPEVKPTIETPEFIRHKTQARIQNLTGPMLKKGQALLEHAVEPAATFNLAEALRKHGRPLLVVTRQSPERLKVNHQIEFEDCRWLTEKEHERTLEPSLESIRKAIDSFFHDNLRAVLVLEGIEYLAGIHGEKQVIEMVRGIVDETRYTDNVMFLTSNLDAFTKIQRSRLIRELNTLETTQIDSWLLDEELLLDHPFCQPPDEEELAWIEQHLQESLAGLRNEEPEPMIPEVEQIPLPVIEEEADIDEEVEVSTDETEESFEEEVVILEPEIELIPIVKKPRPAQRIVRRRKNIKSKPSNKRVEKLNAASKRVVEVTTIESDIVQPPRLEHLAKAAASVQEHRFPEQKKNLTSQRLNRAAVSSASKKLSRLPPIKGKKTLRLQQRPAPAESNVESKTSPHAREYASATQHQEPIQELRNDKELDDSDEEGLV